MAILTSGFALTITSGQRLTMLRLASAAVAMGAGISTMHYMGMAAITVLPGAKDSSWKRRVKLAAFRSR
jgi:NO-binding membrane sensor protein with MHYT domain